MTEVRNSNNSFGVFATKSFDIGDVIFQEDLPIAALAPSTPEQEEVLLNLMAIKTSSSNKGKKKNKKAKKISKTTLYQWINPPPTTIADAYKGKFKGMVQAAACFSLLFDRKQVQEKLLELYYPKQPSDVEKDIVRIAREAVTFIQKHAKPESSFHKLASEQTDLLMTVMLVWSCNAFEGGRIYEQVSRINHSCDPNAVVVESGSSHNKNNGITIKAGAPISVGEEINISYLGLFLYADTRVRQEHLLRNKHFTCQCSRCSAGKDMAAAAPCPSCHRRHGRYLDEDVQYDDEQAVHYCMPDAKTLNTYVCDHCHESSVLPEKGDPNHPLRLLRTVSDKVLNYLQDKEHILEKVGNTGDGNTNGDNSDDMAAEWEEQLIQLSSSIAGARHWTTNIMLLLQVDRTLRNQHSAMILGGTQPDMSDVAEGIDSLERLCRFASGLSLKLHMGHMLSNVVIGVARTLVSLGDVKSQKYAAEWISKIKTDYTDHFESDGMKKVVDTLYGAWENPTSNDMTMQYDDEGVEDAQGQSNKKRMKTH